MSINVGQGFKRTSRAPIDDSIVLTKSEMVTMDDTNMPDVYFAVCKDDGSMYVYNKQNTASSESGKFTQLAADGRTFIAQIGTTSAAELKSAISGGKTIVGCMDPADISTYILPTYVAANTIADSVTLTYTVGVDGGAHIIRYTVVDDAGTTTWEPELFEAQGKLTAGTGIDITDNSISALTNAVELTHSEYEALPAEEKANGTIYFVTDEGESDSGGQVSMGAVYKNGIRYSNVPTATDSVAGVVKLNTAESIYVDTGGHLVVGGRTGQFPGGGIYFPTSIQPTNVGASSFLMSDGAQGLSLAQRGFAILAGAGIACKRAAPGTTNYHVSNTYQNRFACFAVRNGRAAMNQQDAMDNGTAQIVSILFASGEEIRAHFGPPESDNDIIITLDRTVNPQSTITQLRCYGTNVSTDNILMGQGVGASGGKCISLGQVTYAAGNQTVAIGNAVHVMANNSAGFGHSMLINQQYCLGVGQGHDFTAGANGTTAVGTWSEVHANTKLAVGNGTSYTARSNILEVIDDGGATGLVVKAPNGTAYKLSVTDEGTLTVSPA